jgi:virulence-associated protein VapD
MKQSVYISKKAISQGKKHVLHHITALFKLQSFQICLEDGPVNYGAC